MSGRIDVKAVCQSASNFYAPATFYTHFEDKLALLLAIYERWVEQEWEEIRSLALTGERRAILTAIIDI